jgi:hypothetical protein
MGKVWLLGHDLAGMFAGPKRNHAQTKSMRRSGRIGTDWALAKRVTHGVVEVEICCRKS